MISHDNPTTAAQATPDAQSQLQQISDLVDENAALAEPAGNTDLMIVLFLIRQVLGDDVAHAGRRINRGRTPPN